MAGIFGAIVGSPTLRVRGDYLAIVTLAFGEIFTRSAQNNIGGLTGGSNAIPGIPPVSLFGAEFNQPICASARFQLPARCPLLRPDRAASSRRSWRCSRTSSSAGIGRAWIAIREDEDAARAMGIRTGRSRSSRSSSVPRWPGLAGAFFAHKNGTVSYESFQFLESVTLLAAVILGGMGTIPGAVLGRVAAVRAAREAA